MMLGLSVAILYIGAISISFILHEEKSDSPKTIKIWLIEKVGELMIYIAIFALFRSGLVMTDPQPEIKFFGGAFLLITYICLCSIWRQLWSTLFLKFWKYPFSFLQKFIFTTICLLPMVASGFALDTARKYGIDDKLGRKIFSVIDNTTK